MRATEAAKTSRATTAKAMMALPVAVAAPLMALLTIEPSMLPNARGPAAWQ